VGGESAARQFIEVALFILGGVGTLLYGVLSWLLLDAVKRRDSRIDAIQTEIGKLQKELEEQQQRLDWVRTILAMAGLIPAPSDPTHYS
jgi:septal ring factor EnvC (AmiA/AmiB activator)